MLLEGCQLEVREWKDGDDDLVAGIEEAGLIEVTWTGASSCNVQDDLYLCFENKRISGGGPIEKLIIDEQDCVAIIKFAVPTGIFAHDFT